MPKHSVLGRVKPLSGIRKDPDQLQYDELNGPLTVDSEASDHLATLFPSFKEHAIEGVAGVPSDGATTNQKNTEDAVEVGEAEESSEEK